ncbi:MAG: TetR/AcrR family transcriptional regulator [Bacillota bacterium]
MPKDTFKNEQELIGAALEEFSQNSFDEASINRILKRAGVSKGVFYYHFQDKEALYFHLMEEAAQQKWEFITVEIQSADFENADIFGQFRIQAQAGIRFAAVHPQYYRFAKMVAKEKNPRIRAHIDSAFVKSDRIEKMIDRAIQKRNFSEEYTKEFLVAVIGHLFAHFDDIFPNDREAYEHLDNYITMMKNGLSAK